MMALYEHLPYLGLVGEYEPRGTTGQCESGSVGTVGIVQEAPRRATARQRTCSMLL